MKPAAILTWLLFGISISCFTIAEAQTAINDSLALVDLYNSTDGVNWKNNTNWLTSKPASTWYGVNITGKRVISLSLNSNKLHGTIPATIGNLTQLTGLYLYQNQLSGTIPSSVGSLVNLVSLSISDNRLSGVIPASIGNLVNLQYIDLYTNQLSGTIPAEIGNLVNITGLYLYDNQLSGALPAEIGNMASLKELYLYNNQFSGAIPVTIGNLVHLTALELNDNQFSGRIPSGISKLQRLQYLYLNSNQFNGTIPASLGKLKRLIALHLEHNRLSGSVPYSFRKLNNLSYIDLSYNRLSQDENVDFLSLIEFTSGSINHNRFTFNGLEFVAKKYFNIIYAPQNTVLPIHQNGNALSVSAGGTLSNNTYKWFRAGATDSTIIKGDSTFTPLSSGQYYAKVTNAIATKLTFRTDTIVYAAALQSTVVSLSANVLQIKSGSNKWLVYPNPASNIVHIQINGTTFISITNNAGKVVLSKNINGSGDINVSHFASGTYYIQNKTTGEVQKIVVVH